MTCIVGLVDNGKIYMGGDSAGVGGLSIETRKQPKVFINGQFLIGYTTLFRMGQVLQYKLKPPKMYEDEDVFKFMVVNFIDSVRQCLKDAGFAEKEKEVESGGIFLVGYKGRLFKIESDYQVGEVLRNYTACGCGEQYAMGAMYSTERLGSKERIKIALQCAQEHSVGVREPFHILEI